MDAGPRGVNVAGYLGSVLGVGEAARQVAGALEAASVPVARVEVAASHSRLEPGEAGGSAADVRPEDAPHPVNLICVNAEALPAFASETGPAFFRDRYSIGHWWWEVESFPESFASSFDYLDEVWVGSRHVAEALEPVSPVPVVAQPVPVSVEPFEPRARADLGLPEGFLFLFVFDYNSVFERKNPLALVEAFRRAFPPDAANGAGPSLVLKTINAERDARNHERLLGAAAGHPDVHVIDRHVPRADKDAMIAACDCYASLHRAEGFGITLAEAMLLGTPVLATGYSGNLEFTTPQNSYLVEHELVPIGPGNDPYPAEGLWAEPDLEHAAAMMRDVVEHPDRARKRAERAREQVRERHSPEQAGRAMANRLRRVGPESGRGAGPRSVDTGPLATRIAGGPERQAASASGLRRRARGGLLRLLRPYSVHQRRVDNELLEAIQALDRAVSALDARLVALEKRLDAAEPRDDESPNS